MRFIRNYVMILVSVVFLLAGYQSEQVTTNDSDKKPPSTIQISINNEQHLKAGHHNAKGEIVSELD